MTNFLLPQVSADIRSFQLSCCTGCNPGLWREIAVRNVKRQSFFDQRKGRKLL